MLMATSTSDHPHPYSEATYYDTYSEDGENDDHRYIPHKSVETRAAREQRGTPMTTDLNPFHPA